jgi:hypothetical protein
MFKSFMLKFLTFGIVVGTFLAIAQPASAQRVFIRRPAPVVVVRPYYGWGPGWYGYGYGYGPWWGPAYVTPRPNTGEVKLVTRMKDASVYVDGGFAGFAGKLKKFDLTPGNHDIALRDSRGATLFQERIQVIRDKTTEIKVD